MAAEGGAAPAPHSSSNPPSADPAWAHGIVVDMARRKVQCKYCNRVLSGGVFRLKQHLAGIKGEVAPCSKVSAEVRMQFCQYMKEKETSKANTSRRRQEIREELSAPPRRSVDLPRGRQTIDLDDDDEAEATPSETIDIEEVFEEEHPLHAWVNATTSVEPEFDPHDRAWAEGELDDVPLLPEFETLPAPKRQKKTVGARGRSKKHGISIADLETIEEDIDDETPTPSDNVEYQTSNDSTSKTSTPSEGSDHGGDVLVVSSVPPPAPPPDPIIFTGEEDFTHATQDQHHGSRQGREAQTSSQQYARKGKKVASQLQGQGQGQGASEDSGYNPNFIPHRRNWLMKKKKMQEEWERQEKLRMEFETMEQASDTSSYASTEGYYQGQGGYLGYPQYPDASYYTGGGRSSPLYLGQTRSGSAQLGRAGVGIGRSDRFGAGRSDLDPRVLEPWP
ncbi:hypothetical protein Taro_036648 [Colocasia esculenta]|uniref:BED-type domain-containing protein n=1 Tax=Colocasia esculenta TaxID=4460 RepID=A0A843W8Z1_COLES|nr:hypothetical protein [Colocasia esculenta]